MSFEVPKENLPRMAPHIVPEKTGRADDDRKSNELTGNIRDLHRWAKTYIHCVALIQLADMQIVQAMRQQTHPGESVWPEWHGIGARSAVLAARNYGHALAAASAAAKFFPCFRTEGYLRAFADARNAFDRIFPNVERARHSVAHPERYPDPKQNMGTDKDHDGPGIAIVGGINTKIQDSVLNGIFFCTFAGEYVSCPVTPDAAVQLKDITNALFAAFGGKDCEDGDELYEF